MITRKRKHIGKSPLRGIYQYSVVQDLQRYGLSTSVNTILVMYNSALRDEQAQLPHRKRIWAGCRLSVSLVGRMVVISRKVCRRLVSVNIGRHSANRTWVGSSEGTCLSEQGVDDVCECAWRRRHTHRPGDRLLLNCDPDRRYQKIIRMGSAPAPDVTQRLLLAFIFNKAAR